MLCPQSGQIKTFRRFSAGMLSLVSQRGQGKQIGFIDYYSVLLSSNNIPPCTFHNSICQRPIRFLMTSNALTLTPPEHPPSCFHIDIPPVRVRILFRSSSRLFRRLLLDISFPPLLYSIVLQTPSFYLCCPLQTIL